MATKSRPELKLVPTQYTLQVRRMAQMQVYPLKILTENKQHTVCVAGQENQEFKLKIS